MFNIFGLLVEQLDYDRLIEEGRDPVEVLRYKYQDVPSAIIDNIVAIDPTRKKSYSQWVLSKWNEEGYEIKEYLVNGKLARLFKFLHGQNAVQARSFPSVVRAVELYVPDFPVWHKTEEPTVWVANMRQTVDSSLANDFDIVYQSDEWIVAVPNTYEAECQLAEGMHWCTANAFGNGPSYYNQYLHDYGGKYYVNIDLRKGETAKDNGKEYPYTRYQFHFESNQYKDQHDDQISLNDIDMPHDVYEFYESEGKDMGDMEDVEVRYDNYMERRYDDAYILCNEPELYLNVEVDDEYYYHEPEEDAEWYLFDENDDRDPISWGHTFKNPNSVDVVASSGDGYFILNTSDGNKAIVVNTSNYNAYTSRVWEVDDLADGYLELPGSCGVLGVVKLEYQKGPELCHFTPNSKRCFHWEEGMSFIYRWEIGGVHYVETIGRSHGLIALSPIESGYVIRGDIPKNGEHFEVDDDGVIKCRFRNYRIDMRPSDNNLLDDYAALEEIDGDTYILESGEGQNIYSRRMDGLVFDEDVDKITRVGSMYITETDERLTLYSNDFREIVSDCSSYSTEKTDSGFLLMTDSGLDGIHFINMKEERETARFAYIEALSRKLDVAVVGDEDGNDRIYDFTANKFLYPEVTDVKPSLNCLFCETSDEETIIMNFNTMEVIDRGIVSKYIGNSGELALVEYADKKKNLCNKLDCFMVIDHGVDKILMKNDFYSIAAYSEGGLAYVVSTRTVGKVYTNPNGFRFGSVSGSWGTIDITSEGNNIRLRLNAASDGLKPDSYSVSDNKNYVGNYYFGGGAKVPSEVLEFYRSVMGQELPAKYGGPEGSPGPGPDEVRENFNRVLGRIERASRNM